MSLLEDPAQFPSHPTHLTPQLTPGPGEIPRRRDSPRPPSTSPEFRTMLWGPCSGHAQSLPTDPQHLPTDSQSYCVSYRVLTGFLSKSWRQAAARQQAKLSSLPTFLTCYPQG